MILFKIFPEDRPPPLFSKKFLSFTENFLISYDFLIKKVPCTFRKFQKTPTLWVLLGICDPSKKYLHPPQLIPFDVPT